MSYFSSAGLAFFLYLLYFVWPIALLIMTSTLLKFRFGLPITIAIVTTSLLLGGPVFVFTGIMVALFFVLFLISF
jgi:hypothetical protein